MNSYTTNGAPQYDTSGEKCLDLFTTIGNMRGLDRQIVLENFTEAFTENPQLAVRVAFWARASRVGAGERKTFFTILDEIRKTSPEFIEDNSKTLAELGYWKDLVRYLDLQGVVKVFAQAIKDGDRLACKWAPRKCSELRDELGMTNKGYRKWLKKHSDTTEQIMSEKKWSDIEYSSVPGSAMRKYSRAFDRNDTDRFDSWKNDKTTKASVSATYPHQILETADGDDALADKLWNNLTDFVKPGETILPMIDVSGSMFGNPLNVAISLGMYLAEKNKSEFKDTFLTFSESPQFVRLKGDTFFERYQNISRADWGMNTDFESAYRLILDKAKLHKVDPKSMPTMLLVLSDMQFDESQSNGWNEDMPHFDHMKRLYEEAGYKFPKLVFWNLDARPGTPARCSDKNVGMVCGFSPSIMKAVLDCDDFTPMNVMMEALKPIELDYTNLSEVLEIGYQQEVF